MHEQSNDELMHYGVLGMKWGVNRDRSGTINKSYKKLGRLDSDIANKSRAASKAAVKAGTGASKKYMNLNDKANKLQSKADKKKYGLFSNAEKAAELQVKADRARYKANKYKSKYEKRANIAAQTKAAEAKAKFKADKWAKKMNKYITETKTSELNAEQIALARKYLGM